MQQFHSNILRRPLPRDLVKSRPGSFGSTLDYVEYGAVVNILDEAFGPNWTFEIKESQINKRTGERWDKSAGKKVSTEITECIVLGSLQVSEEVGYVIREQFGQCESNDGIGIGDALKGAASDALKKCATLMGVALELYGPEYELKPRLSITAKQDIARIMRETGCTKEEVNEKFSEWSKGLYTMTDVPDSEIKEFADSLTG